MKIVVYSDEAYPVYGFNEWRERDKFFVEVTAEEAAWCRRVEDEYNSVQEFLAKKQEEQWRNLA